MIGGDNVEFLGTFFSLLLKAIGVVVAVILCLGVFAYVYVVVKLSLHGRRYYDNDEMLDDDYDNYDT